MTDIQQQFNTAPSEASTDDRSPQEQQQEAQLAERLSKAIEDANERCLPLMKMVRKVALFSRRRKYPA